MKKLIAALALFGVLGFAGAPVSAQDKPAEAPAAAAPAAAPAAAAAAAPAPAAPAAAPAPTPNKGDTAWMLTATVLVILMTIPGLALFYGGMVRSKNMLSTLMQIFAIFCVIAVLWVVYGYSMAFSNGNAFFGGLSKTLLSGVVYDANGFFVATATFSKGVVIPEMLFAFFQLTFATITVGLIAGGYAERMKFSAVLIFSVLWFTLSYIPMAHMVWWWPGPDAYTGPDVVAELNSTAGYLWQLGALDFAGGTAVHINAGAAGLALALILGKRAGFGKVAMRPHSLPLVMLGSALLWFGWFGFNAGSAVASNGTAGLALLNTIGATTAAVLAWLLVEKVRDGHATSLGAASGVVAGLVAITPACAAVNASGALIIGAVAGALCALSVGLKFKLGYDDSLDVVAVHLVGGIVGTVMIGFVGVEVGLFNGGGTEQLVKQVIGAGAVLAYSFIATLIIGKIIDLTIGFRITHDEEIAGIDLAIHAERAYELSDNSQGSVFGISKGA